MSELDLALTIKCAACNARPGDKCASIVDASKYLETPHAPRRQHALAQAQKG